MNHPVSQESEKGFMANHSSDQIRKIMQALAKTLGKKIASRP
jgi:hypothetical protein